MAAEDSNYLCQPEEESWSAIDDWEGFLREAEAEGHEMIKKLVSKVEENMPSEEVLREAWHHFRGKIARKMGRREGEEEGLVKRERGDMFLEGELKNERFKVKTMNLPGSGVVEEDDQK